ncbi:hypothetical protein ACFRCG_03355 [Embleya sp. NPDC056575]|uniref:hypothetical protein n=1 Tax=unclassified Embleya TaxID=2699296 RepID=UPI0036BC230D
MGSTTATTRGTERVANTSLRREAGARGWSSAREFAAGLDAEAQRLELGVVFDERTVRRWLSGHSRWPQCAHRLALERIFGLPCVVLGFVSPMGADTTVIAGPARVFGGRDGADIVAVSPAAGGSDVERREFLVSTGAVLGLLSLSDTSAASAVPLAHTGTIRVGAGDVARVRAMTTALGDAAAELGGGVARTAAVRYLTDEASPLLDGTYTDTTGRELHSAVGELAHLIAWMAQDEGAPGLAQRYFAQAHRLGDLGADRELASTALRGMAVQAIDAGRRATATRCLLSSQTHIERALAHTSGTSWASHYSIGRWAHESGMVLARLGELDEARAHLRHALDVHGLDRRRSRVIVLADLGEIHLRADGIPGADELEHRAHLAWASDV